MIGVLLAAAASCAAQDPTSSAAPNPPAPLVVRIAVDRIQLDAVVTDRDGRPVTDLGAADFEVAVSGRVQKVTNVVYVGRKGASSPTGERPEVRAAGPRADAGRNVVFVIDDLGLSFSGLYQARRALGTLAGDGLEAGDELALVQTGREPERLVFTSDVQGFRAAVDELQYDLRSVRGVSAAPLGPLDTGSSDPAWARTAFDRRLNVIASTLDALRARPGRKALALVSEGMALPVRPDRMPFDFERGITTLYGDGDVAAGLRAVTDLANRGSVVIYALDPRGLAIDAPDASQSIEGHGGPDSTASGIMRVRWQSRQRDQGGLRDLANGTGGLAVLNRNDLPNGLADILSDLGAYYLIGWDPETSTFDRRSGRPRFHTVKIKVRRAGLRVRSRQGFYGLTDEAVASAAPAPTLY